MPNREVRSPNNSGPDHPRFGESPGANRSPSVDRPSGHIAGHVGKAASSPASLKRPGCEPPVEGENRSAVADRR
jgi:hypothetical protein